MNSFPSSNTMQLFLSHLRSHPLSWFFLLAFTWSWSFVLLAYLVFENSLFLAWIGLFGPALAALVMTVICDGQAGLKRLLASLFCWRVPSVGYALVIGIPLLLVTGTILLHDGVGGVLSWLQIIPELLPLLLGLSLLLVPVVAGEEIGWRGFALPRLQARSGPLRASLVVGFLWGIWHIPSALDPSNVLNRGPLMASVPLFILGTIGFSLLYTWLWNFSGGSLLLICLLHSFYNTLNTTAATPYPFIIDQFWLYLAVLALVLLGLYFLNPNPGNERSAEKK